MSKLCLDMESDLLRRLMSVGGAKQKLGRGVRLAPASRWGVAKLELGNEKNDKTRMVLKGRNRP